MEIFNINFKRLITLLLPNVLRSPVLYSFLFIFHCGIINLYYIFRDNREKNINRLRCNGQKCKLRKLLNDTLDPIEQRIEVLDGKLNGDWLFVRDEEYPVQVFTGSEGATLEEDNPVKIIFSEESIIGNETFFTVKVPWKPFIDEKEGKKDQRTITAESILNEYKLLGRKYIIK